MKTERVFIVAYDICDQKRWRKVFKTMKGYGQWLQLSVFQCRLSERRKAELVSQLDNIVHHDEDQVVIIDVGEATTVQPKIESLGKAYQPIEKKAVIV